MSYVSTSYIWIKISHTKYDDKFTESQKNLGWEGPARPASKSDQVAWGLLLLSVDCLQAWRFHSLFGQPHLSCNLGWPGLNLSCDIFFSLYPYIRISLATTCGHHSFSFCCTPTGRVWLHLFWVYLAFSSPRTNSVVSASVFHVKLTSSVLLHRTVVCQSFPCTDTAF